jgi:hypothetical protein
MLFNKKEKGNSSPTERKLKKIAFCLKEMNRFERDYRTCPFGKIRRTE